MVFKFIFKVALQCHLSWSLKWDFNAILVLCCYIFLYKSFWLYIKRTFGILSRMFFVPGKEGWKYKLCRWNIECCSFLQFDGHLEWRIQHWGYSFTCPSSKFFFLLLNSWTRVLACYHHLIFVYFWYIALYALFVFIPPFVYGWHPGVFILILYILNNLQ